MSLFQRGREQQPVRPDPLQQRVTDLERAVAALAVQLREERKVTAELTATLRFIQQYPPNPRPGLEQELNPDLWYSSKLWSSDNDGPGSGLDADTVDGSHAADFATAAHLHDSRYVNETDHTTATHNALAITPGAHATSHDSGGSDEIAMGADSNLSADGVPFLTAAPVGTPINGALRVVDLTGTRYLYAHVGGGVWERVQLAP